MARVRVKLTLFIAALLTVPVLLLVAEGCVRLFMRKLDPLEVFVSSPQLRLDTQGETTKGMFEFDPLLTWRLKPNLRSLWWDYTPVTTNGAHLRMERELSAKRGLRIVCLGDSVTFGYRVPVAHSKEKPADFDPAQLPYPRALEDFLRAKHPGREIEVLPLACPGYTSTQGLAWLRRDIAELRPDIVTACFGWNNVRAAGLPDSQTMPSGGAQIFVRGLMAKSQLLLHIASGAQSKREPLIAPPPEPRTTAEEYVAHFLEMRALCQQHGAWFGVVLPVYRDTTVADEAARMSRYRAQLRDSAATSKIPVLEIPELTETASPKNEPLFGERIHPNADGHALMMERIAEFIGPVVAEKVK